MGMSASQARYLGLVARQTNLEYQGQQINQERTILSQQCTALYNSLLAMTVPTPPSTSDFTTIKYTGNDGATQFSLGVIKPSGSKHMVEICTTATGDSLAVQYGTSVVKVADAEIPGYIVDTASERYKPNEYTRIGTTEPPSDGEYFMQALTKGSAISDWNNCYIVKEGHFVLAKQEDYSASAQYYQKVQYVGGSTEFNTTPTENKDRDYRFSLIDNVLTSISGYYVVEGDKVRKAKASDFDSVATGFVFKTGEGAPQYVRYDANSGTTYANANAGQITIAGELAMQWDTAEAMYPELDWGRYEQAVKNKYQGDVSITKDSFMVFVTVSESGVIEPHFALNDDVRSADGRATVYDYSANGKYTESKVVDGCILTFDVSGRISAIDIPIYDEMTGELLTYNTIALEANTVTDELAYQDAYAQYEYAQYQYDKAQQEINAKTQIIQEEDRNLELKLTRLDNERNAIKTEMDAVKKVIDENIEKSFKTFAG